MGFLTRLIAGFVAASTLGAGLAGTANAVDAAGAASDTTGAVTTTADDTGGRTVLDCRQSGEGATGPYADKFCWIDWSNLPLDSSGKPTPVRINVPGGHIDADATITHTDNAALAAKDFTGSKWSRLTSAYKLTGNTALAFSGRMGRQDPAASVTFSNITPSADRTDTGVNVLKDFQLAFGDAEVMSGGVLQGHDVYEQTDIESDKTLEKLGMIGSGDPNQSYSKANTGYGTTHVTLAGGPKGATDDANKDSKGSAVVGAKQASRFKVSFGQVNQHWDGWGSAIAVGVYMPYLTAYPLTYDKNSSDAAGEVPSNQRGKENTTQPAKTKTNGTVKTVADTNASLPDYLVNGDFEYPGADVLNNKGNWWGVSRKDRMVFAPQPRWVSLPSTFDSDRFAWDSTEVARVQNESSQWHTNEVELQRDSRTGNMYAELCAYQAHTSIRQYIHTTPGTLYKVRLKHASLSRDYLDKMQVLIGPDGNEQPVRMTRVESQNGLDATGKATASTTVSTHASNEMEIKDGSGPYSSRNHDGQWATYEGVYVATSDVTSFTFKSIDSKQYNLGNLLDDIVFDKAYRLSYDKNATDANGSVPSDETAGTVKQAKAKTNGALRLASDDDVATYAASNLPDHIVNGSFDYPSVPSWTGLAGSSSNKNNKGKRFATINPSTGKYGSGCAMSTTGKAIPNWNRSSFAWNSTQGDAHYPGMSCETGNVELNYDSVHHNQFAELTADQQGTAIYQDVKATPGTMMTWSLKHSSATSAYVDKMQVMIGEPYKETAQEATRIASENGNKVGEKMTTISTPTTSDRADNKKLTYDKNSSDAAGQVPSNQRGKENTVQPAKSKTNGTVKTVADENVRYGSLANGDFSYPSFSDIQKNEQETPADLRTFLKSDDGTLWYNMSATDFSKYGKIGQIPGFDSSRFAWSSTENGSRVELQQDRNTKNTYAEIVAQQDNTSIYQSVSTGNGGVLYKIRLKHASRQSSHVDRMQVLVGSDTNHATPVEMTRVTSNGHGDKVGGKSTTITTKVSNTDPRDHGAQWETYEGYYQVPEGQKNTVFMFKSLEGFKEDETLPGNNIGNLVDDIEFSRSYKLTYDKNSDDATGSVPSDTTANTVKQAKAKSSGTVRLAADRTDGKVSDLVQRTTTHADGSVTVRTVDTTTDVVSGCQVYYPAGQKITLATMAKDDDCWDSSMLSRPGHTQLGWNQDRNATQAQAEVTMVEGGMAVYAVWVGNPVLTYDTNKPATWSGQMPSTPASVSVTYNTAVTDGSGWRAGDTTKIRGYRFLGWYTGPQDNAGLYDWTRPLTGNVTVYAHWQRLQANVVYNANGGTGSHANTTGWQYSDVTVPGDVSKSFKHDGLYRFKHWNTQPNDQGTVYTDGSRIALQDKDITLYAIWVPYHENFVPTGGIGLPIAIAGGVLLLMFGIGSTVMLTRRMNGHGMPDDE